MRWTPPVGGSVWASMIDRQSYIEVKPKVAETSTGDGGGSSATTWIMLAGAVVVVAVLITAVVVRRRGRGRAVEE